MSIQWNDILAMAPQTILILGALSILVLQISLKVSSPALSWQLALITLGAALLVAFFGLSDMTGAQTVLPRAFSGTETVSAIHGSYKYSAFSANFLVVIICIAITALLFMQRLMPSLELNFSENYFFLLMSLAGYGYAVCAEDLATFFVGLELGSLPMLVLIGMNRRDRASNEAAVKYLLLSGFAIAFLLLGIAMLYGGTGTIRIREIKEIGPHFTKTRVITLGYVFIIAGFLFKIAAFPMQSYVADVYEGTATIFTSLVASLSKIASVLLFFKIYLGVHDGMRQYLGHMLAFAAIGSMLYGSFTAMATSNLKRILAYSSITHAGYMLCFFVIPVTTDAGIMAVLKQEAGSALFIYAAGYAAATLLAFGTIAYFERYGNDGAAIDIDSISGLYGRDKLAAWALGIALLSFLGLPPLAGFLGKFFLFRYLALSGNLTLAAVAALASGISVFAYIRVLKPLFLDKAVSNNVEKSQTFFQSYSEKFGLVLIAAFVTFFVFLSGFLYTNGIASVQKIY
jgi:NADH-quinone oxidoreductase subunit N